MTTSSIGKYVILPNEDQYAFESQSASPLERAKPLDLASAKHKPCFRNRAALPSAWDLILAEDHDKFDNNSLCDLAYFHYY